MFVLNMELLPKTHLNKISLALFICCYLNFNFTNNNTYNFTINYEIIKIYAFLNKLTFTIATEKFHYVNTSILAQGLRAATKLKKKSTILLSLKTQIQFKYFMG